MTGYDFQPEARFVLNEIWEFIRAVRTALIVATCCRSAIEEQVDVMGATGQNSQSLSARAGWATAEEGSSA